MQTTKVELVTPEFAKALLANSKANRRIKKSAVIQYAQAMRRGDWQPNAGEPIQILEDGSTGNGHHRAYAVIMSNLSVRMLVSRDVPYEARLNLDRGLRRTLEDDFKMFRPKEGYTGRRAAYMRLCVQLLSPDARINTLQDYDAWAKLFGKGVNWAVERFCSVNGPMCKAGIAASLAFVHKADQDAVSSFADQLVGGSELKKGSPALAMRNYATSMAYGLTKDSKSRLVVARKTIAAFDAFRNGETIAQVRDNPPVFREYAALYAKAAAPLIEPWLQELPDPLGEKENSEQGELPLAHRKTA